MFSRHARNDYDARLSIGALVPRYVRAFLVAFGFFAGPFSQAQTVTSVEFGQPRYFVRPGETYAVSILVKQPSGQRLASFGVRLSFESKYASIAGVSDIDVNSALSFDGPFADVPVIATGPGFAAAKGTVRFALGQAELPSNETLVTFLLRDLGSGPYSLKLGFFNTLGPTEQIFVNDKGAVLDGEIIFGTAEVLPTGGIEIGAVSDIVLNRQTGVFEQTIQLLNKSHVPVTGAVVAVNHLPPAWTVWNASGTHLGTPFLKIRSTIPSEQTLAVRVEFRIPDRKPTQSPSYSIIDFDPGEPVNPIGESFTVTPRATLPDGSFLLEFRSLAGRSYSIQYSSDLTNWFTVTPAHTGNGSQTQWIDYGPPKTGKHPSEEATRFYRVFLVP